jgi:hypothetical protein
VKDLNAHSLGELRADFLGTSTNAMPIAGAITWAALGIAALFLPERTIGTLSLYIMVAIMPLAFLIERAQGRNLFAGGDNPLVKLFLSSIAMIGAIVPLVIVAATSAEQPLLILLGMAILAGVIWIPYGWAADDPAGMRHAIARTVGCYLAYAFAPDAYVGTAICAVVVLSYLFTLATAKTMGERL